jgi:hypothetical protein
MSDRLLFPEKEAKSVVLLRRSTKTEEADPGGLELVSNIGLIVFISRKKPKSIVLLRKDLFMLNLCEADPEGSNIGRKRIKNFCFSCPDGRNSAKPTRQAPQKKKKKKATGMAVLKRSSALQRT